MHDSRALSCVLWKDKRPVLLISTHALPVNFPCVPMPTVPHTNGAIQDDVPTSPVHLEYTTHMRGVDVVDQLRASYTCQTRSHKWWHRVFSFLLDTIVVNMYLIYKDLLQLHLRGKSPITHLQFKTNFCDALLMNSRGRDVDIPEDEEARQHLPTWTRIHRVCLLCGDATCCFYCRACNRSYLCLNRGCFAEFHFGTNGRQCERRQHHRGR